MAHMAGIRDMIHGKYSIASDCVQVKSEELHRSLPLNKLLFFGLFTRSAAFQLYSLIALTEYMILTYINTSLYI